MTDWNEEVQRAAERTTEITTAVIRKKGNRIGLPKLKNLSI